MEVDPGVVKWGILAGTILALEVVGQETLTGACYRALEHKVGRYVVPFALGFTAAHLLDVIPDEIDPYQWIARGIDRVKG
jgi:hypothetical protein